MSPHTAPDTEFLAPGLRVVIAGTVGRRARPERYYAGPGNQFWRLLHDSGLVPERLGPDDAARLAGFGVGLTDLVLQRVERAGREPEVAIGIDDFAATIGRYRPQMLAFVSKTAATWCARGCGERLPRGYGPLDWTVAGVPTFVLPGPSGANNGMPLPLRIGLWRDLTDHLELAV
jgi:TDG/mug DNA glycosylase family protein